MLLFHKKIIIPRILINFCLLIAFPILSFSITTYTTILYFKTDYLFNGIEHIDANNISKYNYSYEDLMINGQLYKVEIKNSFYNDVIKLDLLNSNSSEYHIGFLLQIQDRFYDPEFTIMPGYNEFNCSVDMTFIQINETYAKELKYCKNITESTNVELYIYIPFNIYENCYSACTECSFFGNETNHNCIKCNNSENYYFIEEDNSHNCYSKDSIELGYFLDEDNKIFKKCSNRCLTCSNNSENCTKCINESYHFHPNIENNCIMQDELPNNNYYLDKSDDKYKICYERCLVCTGPNETDCLSCNNSKGYYSKEDDIKCYSIDEIEEGFYFDYINNTIKKCNNRCFSCNQSGTNEESNCIKCNNNESYHFHPYIDNHCITKYELSSNYYLDPADDKFKICNERCSECDGPNETQCVSCNNSNGYYSKEDDTMCYSIDEIVDGYYFDSNNNIIKKCNNRCFSCNQSGTNEESNCIKCNNNENYHFHPYIDNHCITQDELSTNYYLDPVDDKFKICNERCSEYYLQIII